MGVSFAIPIDVAMEIQSQLRSSGKVSRGRLGVVIQEVTKELADSLGLSKPMGAVVNAVEKGGPAEKAGIEAGDVILKFDGKVINNSADLPRFVGATHPGLKAVVHVWRKGSTREIAVIVGEMLDEKPVGARQSRNARPTEQVANRIGLIVSELTAEQKRELKMNSGLLIEEVRGSGARADLRPGDIIIAVISKGATTEVKSAEQFNKLLMQFDKGSNVTLLIRRGEMQTFVTIKGFLNGN